jgi:hypothetical protein
MPNGEAFIGILRLILSDNARKHHDLYDSEQSDGYEKDGELKGSHWQMSKLNE